MAKSHATIYDVAKRAGVSHMTVSRAFSGSGPVGKKARERIQRVARELDFSPSALARGLNGAPTRTIGLLWSLSSTGAPAVRGMAVALQSQGYQVHITDHLSDDKLVVAALKELRRRQIDGLVLNYSLDGGILDGTLQALQALLEEFPVVILVSTNRIDPDFGMDVVLHDYGKSIRQMMRHYVKTGRRRIGYLGTGAVVGGSKFDVYREMCDEFGLAPVVLHTGDGAHKDPHRVGRILDKYCGAKSLDLDALVCTADCIALAAIQWASTKGIDVPQALAVSGCEQSEAAMFSIPPLASCSRCDERLVEIVNGLLLDRLAASDGPQRKEVVEMEFVWRESAGGRGLNQA